MTPADLDRRDIANMLGQLVVQIRLRSITWDQVDERLSYLQHRLDHPGWHNGAPEANLMEADA